MINKNILTYLFLVMLTLFTSCSYDEKIDTYDVEVQLSEAVADVPVVMTNATGSTATAMTDGSGTARFTLPAGIYSVSASKVTDDAYFRHVCNGSLADIAIGSGTTTVALPVTVTAMQTANPILIKELYVGGCQMNDGSGKFAKDKCIILYNNSSEPVSLNNMGFGMIEPYNAEANTHSFLNGGKLDYADADWVPAINGVWFFQDGCVIEPYSQLVVNVHGAIDNTQTYTNSVNYANALQHTQHRRVQRQSAGSVLLCRQALRELCQHLVVIVTGLSAHHDRRLRHRPRLC